MTQINAHRRTVKEILYNVKYKIDFFQREYKWDKKQIEQLIDDLTSKFLANYKDMHERTEVANYPDYYLGPVVFSESTGIKSIIDGQQRLTSLTLLLIYLKHLMEKSGSKVNIDALIFSEKYAEKSFNLHIPDRKACIESLYKGNEYKQNNHNESVNNILNRYQDIVELFPNEIKGKPLPYFVDWLIDNVIFVEIITSSDEEAYTIFETMNDRGLNLTSTEMLKGYLLANISDLKQKEELNEEWKKFISVLNTIDKDEDLEFFKAFLRAKYAESIRPGKKGSSNEDFEKIGTRFHSWVRDNKNKIGLDNKNNFVSFIENDILFYLKIYVNIYKYIRVYNDNFKGIYNINERGLASSIYYPLLLSPINVNDNEDSINKKLILVSTFLEIYVVFRSVNYKTYSHSSIRYTMYNLVKEIRDKNVRELAKLLKEKVSNFELNLTGMKDLRLHGQNKRFIHFLLARITNYIEKKSNLTSLFIPYVDKSIDKPFQVEHIWGDKFKEHKDEFEQRDKFEEYRNKIGALILLQEGFNQSYGALSYEKKLHHYYGQNLLAKTLTPQCYEKNPSFLKYKNKSGLPFKPHPHFKKKDINERQELYQRICEEIYNTQIFDDIVNG